LNQSIKAIQVSIKNSSLERGHFSLCEGRAARGVGKPSVVLGRLTWKWWSKGHLRCLVEAIKRIDQESKLQPKRELVMLFQVIFLVVLSCKQWSKEEASQPQQDSALDHKVVFHSYGWRFDLSIGIYNWSSPSLLIGLHIAIGEMNWNLCDYPLLQHSKGIIVMCMIISSLTSMRLVHIVHA
jgi:hypothetical protein